MLAETLEKLTGKPPVMLKPVQPQYNKDQLPNKYQEMPLPAKPLHNNGVQPAVNKEPLPNNMVQPAANKLQPLNGVQPADNKFQPADNKLQPLNGVQPQDNNNGDQPAKAKPLKFQPHKTYQPPTGTQVQLTKPGLLALHNILHKPNGEFNHNHGLEEEPPLKTFSPNPDNMITTHNSMIKV
jgi:hypothetical protein